MYKCREKKMPRLNGYKKIKKIKNKYIKIKIKIRCYTLNYKIHKKISLGEYSSLRKKEKKKPFQSR